METDIEKGWRRRYCCVASFSSSIVYVWRPLKGVHQRKGVIMIGERKRERDGGGEGDKQTKKKNPCDNTIISMEEEVGRRF